LALSFRTWNKRTLYQARVDSELVKGILAIQEIRWSGKGSTEIGNAIIFFGQHNYNRKIGTGFIIKKI